MISVGYQFKGYKIQIDSNYDIKSFDFAISQPGCFENIKHFQFTDSQEVCGIYMIYIYMVKHGLNLYDMHLYGFTWFDMV